MNDVEGGMYRFLPPRWSLRTWPAIVTGWLWLYMHSGPGALLLGVLPGSLLLGGGVALLLWPGDARIVRYLALGSILSLILAIPAVFLTGIWFAAVVVFLSVASFVCAGWESIVQIGLPEAVSAQQLNLRTSIKAALDEAMLAYFVGGATARRTCTQVDRVVGILRTADWNQPDRFHAMPTAPTAVEVKPARSKGREFQWVEFDSDYAPPPGVPGAPAWLNAPKNARCRLRVFRQAEVGRPWLLGIHGAGMGKDWLDLDMFNPDRYVRELGYNLVLPVLPLHGARSIGRRSGDHFLDGDPLNLLYAEAQTLWDLRRTVAWIRTQEATAGIGVLGYSLGGYNAALLAAHEPTLDFVVAGIPEADMAFSAWQHLPSMHRRYLAQHGLDLAGYTNLLQVVSPLALRPQLPPERLAIFAGSVDRMVLPEQPLRLARHWQVPVNWYPGGHMTHRGEPAVADTLRRAAAAAGWVSAAENAPG